MRNIFEKATKEKFRYEFKGLISTEDLWDLSVEDLDTIFKYLNAQKRQISEESLLDKETKADTLLNTKIKIIKYIVDEKLKEAENRLLAKERLEKKNKIMEILASKKDDALQNKSEEELQEMLNSL
jgi:hypothetical protein